jgi:hypothetical protein
VIAKLPVKVWDHTQLVRWANTLKVNTTALAIALKENELIDEKAFEYLKQASISSSIKVDPQLEGLTSLITTSYRA